MKITLLGTGSPVPSLKRSSSSYLIEINDDVIVMDHGPGAFTRLMQAGKRALDVSHVFLTHLHFDHCFDFLRLYHHRWDASGDNTRPLKVYGPTGTQTLVDRVFGPNGAFAPDLVSRTSHPQSLGAFRERGGTLPRPWPDTRVNEMTGSGIVEGDGWRIVRREVPHFQPYLDSFGYRIEAGGKVFAYTSDLNLALPGGAPAALHELVEGADLLVHYLNAFAFEARKGHGFAGPKFAAELARDAGVKTLVTSHHGPWIDSDGTRERMIADVGAIYSGRIVWGEDLMSFQI
jgi:ribonuclease BN (tRNA processing enzyme)